METRRYDSIDLKSVSYSQPEKRGAFYYSDITYDNKPLMILCPKLLAKVSGSDTLQKASPCLELEPDTNDFSFYDFLLKIDDRSIKETYDKGMDWFGKSIPLDMIDDMYKRTTKPLKRDQRPSFSFRVPMEKKSPQCKVYTQKRELCSVSDIQAGSHVVTVLHVRGLKFLKQHYYCDCYVSQMQICTVSPTKYIIPDTCVFSDDDGVDGVDGVDEVDEDDKIDEELLQSIQSSEQDRLASLKVCEGRLQSLQADISEKTKELTECQLRISELHSGSD